jgi:hypothetical protein
LGPTKQILVPGFSKIQTRWAKGFTSWCEKGGLQGSCFLRKPPGSAD